MKTKAISLRDVEETLIAQAVTVVIAMDQMEAGHTVLRAQSAPMMRSLRLRKIMMVWTPMQKVKVTMIFQTNLPKIRSG